MRVLSMSSIVVVVLAMVATLAGTGVEAQRQSSRLQQMMQNWVKDVNGMVGRVGDGFMKTLGVDPATLRNQGRQRPEVLRAPPRQNIVDDAAPAPNAPRPQRERQVPRPGRQRPRNRLTFRQFVDGAMAGISNLMPRLRRRISNRNRSARDLSQVRKLAAGRGMAEYGDSSSSSSPTSALAKSIHVTVNLYEGDDEKSGGAREKDASTLNIPNIVEDENEMNVEDEPVTSNEDLHEHFLTVTHYPDHTIHVDHHDSLQNYNHNQTATTTSTIPPSDYDDSLTMTSIAEEGQGNLWPHFDGSLEFPDLDHFFISEFEDSPDWFEETPNPAPEDITFQDITDAGDGFESQISDLTDEGSTSFPNVRRPSQAGENYRNLQYDYKNGFLQGYQHGYDDGRVTSRPTNPQTHFGSSDSNRNTWVSHGGNRQQQGSIGSKGVSSITNNWQQNKNKNKVMGVSMPAGCGVRCLWDDLMKYLDHYSEDSDVVEVPDVIPTSSSSFTPATAMGEMVLEGVHGARRQNQHHHHHNSPQSSQSPPPRFSNHREQTNTHTLSKQHRTNHNSFQQQQQHSSFNRQRPGWNGGKRPVPTPPRAWGPHHQPGPPYSTFPVRLH